MNVWRVMSGAIFGFVLSLFGIDFTNWRLYVLVVLVAMFEEIAYTLGQDEADQQRSDWVRDRRK